MNYFAIEILNRGHNLICKSQVFFFCKDQQASNNLITIVIRSYLETTNHIDRNDLVLFRSYGLY